MDEAPVRAVLSPVTVTFPSRSFLRAPGARPIHPNTPYHELTELRL